MPMFEIFPWNVHLETGIDAIDAQHRMLVQLINRLAQQHVQGASQDAVETILAELADYANYHFRTEEGVWQTVMDGDEAYLQHQISHRRFFDHIAQLQSEQRPFQALLDDLFAYLTQWLAFHILDSDKRMALTLHAVNAGQALQPAKQLADEQMRGASATLIQTVLAMYQTVSAQAIDLMHEKLERQHAEQALKDSESRWAALLTSQTGQAPQWSLAEQRMHAVLNKVPVGLIAAHMNSGVFVFVNDVFCEMTGYERQTLLQMRPLDIHPASEHERIRDDFEKANAGLPPGPMQLKVLRRDGSEFVAEIQRIPLELDGQPALLGIFTDITEKLLAQQALANSESHLRTLVDTIPDLIWLKNADGIYLSCNPSFEHFFGAQEEQIVGKTDHDFVPTDLADFFRQNDLAAMAAQKPKINEEWVTFASDGHRALLETTKVSMRGQDGELIGVLGVAHDITEQRRMQDELTMHRQHLQELVTQRTVELENANALLRRNDERLTAMMAISQELHNLTEEQLLERGVAVAVHSSASTQGEARFVSPALCDDSEAKFLLCTAATEHGQALMHLCVSGKTQPYTEQDAQQLQLIANDLWALVRRQRTEHALAHAKEAAEAASRTKSAFLSNMSHEIRTPLNAIIGFAQMLSRDETLGSRQLDQANIIVKSGQHLLALINDVLDLSKIEAGKQTLQPTDFNLHDLLAELAMMFGMRAEAKGLAMQLQRHPNLPRNVYADEGKLRQVLINLLGNAVKFTQQGQIILLARLDPPSVDEAAEGLLRLHLEVQDSGPGITEHDQKRLFKPFEQAKAGQLAGGTGLGLSISQRLIQLMGGQLSLHSQPGHGSVFSVGLPLALSDHAGHTHGTHRHGHARLSAGHDSVRVLVVDDMPDNRRLLHDLLLPVGFELMLAQNGQDALHYMVSWQPHAVLMDMRMPVLDGYEATRRIKANPNTRHVPVIAVTASAFDDDMQAVFDCGVDAYVRKPIHADEVLDALARALNLRYEQGAHSTATLEHSTPIGCTQVAQLPAPLRQAMRQAVMDGDMTQLQLSLNESMVRFPEVAYALQQLAQDYNYEQLEALLNCPDTPTEAKP